MQKIKNNLMTADKQVSRAKSRNGNSSFLGGSKTNAEKALLKLESSYD